ncbi:MAG: hypothetical protein HKM29_01295 [Deltaproteobacteria bacterium]|nr:hypothetical protein [Deltaproteobacteria bacterium]NNG46066.1 hypothetical protein [Deltaproteobacteria bacterium]
MPRKVIIILFAFLLAVAATAVTAQAETLSWNAVTTYTDGTSIGGATVTYRAYWSTNSNLTNLDTLGSSTTSTSRSFSVDNENMPRGSVIYITVRATVNGTDSALASPLSWNVPAATANVPSAPTNLRMN